MIGDLVQANVLLNQDHEAVLCDFGVARAELFSGFTTSDGVKGTCWWWGPELHVNEDAELSAGSDIWAWACLVVEVSFERT